MSSTRVQQRSCSVWRQHIRSLIWCSGFSTWMLGFGMRRHAICSRCPRAIRMWTLRSDRSSNCGPSAPLRLRVKDQLVVFAAACAACFSLRAAFRVCHDLLSVFGFGFSFLCDSRLFGVVVDGIFYLSVLCEEV